MGIMVGSYLFLLVVSVIVLAFPVFGAPVFFILAFVYVIVDICRTYKFRKESVRLIKRAEEAESIKAGILKRAEEAETKALELEQLIVPELQEVLDLKIRIQTLTRRREKLCVSVSKLKSKVQELVGKISDKKKLLVELDDEILIQEFGLYRPRFDFSHSDKFKEQLDMVRFQQKELIKEGKAVHGNTDWQVNGSTAKGGKVVKDMQKLLLRAFNSECDETVDRVKYNNYEASLKRISTSKDTISKLGASMAVYIAHQYYQLKLDELTLAFEYQQMKQREKEEQKEIRAQMREEAKLQRELEEARKKSEKEKNHYENALARLLAQIQKSGESEELLQKKAELESQLEVIDREIKDIDYREANQRAGYVYIISNLGSFGANIYKIGMTRRLDPTERVDELGDASVPFNFDIHAMIFSNDAPKLESALHHAFDQRKLNMVNTRREFFNVTLDEIKNEVQKNHDQTVEFFETAAAEQYRISQKMKSGAA